MKKSVIFMLLSWPGGNLSKSIYLALWKRDEFDYYLVRILMSGNKAVSISIITYFIEYIK